MAEEEAEQQQPAVSAWIALSAGCVAYLSGSARVSVLAGAVEVLGAQLREGESACVVSPPHEAAVPLAAAATRDVRLGAALPAAIILKDWLGILAASL